MAPLVFLTRTAPARVVATQLSGRCAPGTYRGCGALLLGSTVLAGPGRAIRIARSAFQYLAHERRLRRRWRVALHRHAEDARHDRALDALTKLVEHLERLILVLDQGVALAVRAQPNAFAEMSNMRAVLHPLPVNGPEHHILFDQRHQLGADLFHLRVVRVGGGSIQVLGQGLATLLD